MPNSHIQKMIDENTELLRKLRKNIDQAHSQTEEIVEEAGIDPKQLHTFFSEPHRFDSETWQKIQAHRAKIEAQLDHLISQQEQKKSEATQKRRVPPHLRSRNSHWIFLR